MAGISSPGVGSGLPIQDLVTKLVNAETMAESSRISRMETRYNAELSILGKIKSSLDTLQQKMQLLSDPQTFYALTTTTSDSSIVSASANEHATSGSYQVEVQQLASKQSLSSGVFADPSATVGSGTITIDLGTYDSGNTTFTANANETPIVIDITPGSDDLYSIRDAINNSNSGISANIISDSQGARLSISSKDTGKDLAMRVTVADDDGNNTDNAGLSQLAYDPVNTVNQLSESVPAANSIVRINGLMVEETTNTLNKTIDGITFNLKKANVGTIVDVSISKDENKLKNAVGEFVNQYNAMLDVLNNYTGFNQDTQEGGYFQSDASLRGLKSSLSSLISQSIDTGGNIRSLAEIGIKTKFDGKLELDNDVFTKQLENNYETIGALFARTATVSDTNLRVNNISTDVKAGTYNITIDSYTPGSVLTGTIGGVYANSADGNILNGTGDFKGLSFEILGGSTGNRGEVTIRDGLAVQFDKILENYLGDKGTLTTKTDLVSKRKDQLKTDQEALTAKAARIEKRYLSQFTALDTVIAQMQTTSSFLDKQLSMLPNLTIGGSK